MRPVFVNPEARTVGRQLKQHAPRLPKIDGAKPEAVNHRGRLESQRFYSLAQLVEVGFIANPPCQMVHSAAPPAPARRIGAHANLQIAEPHRARTADLKAVHGVCLTHGHETQNFGQHALGGAQPSDTDLRREQPPNLVFRRHGAAIPRGERTRRVAGDKRQAHPVRVAKPQQGYTPFHTRLDSNPIRLQSLPPVIKTRWRHTKALLPDNACALLKGRHDAPRKEGDVRARGAFRVGIE
ncbi:hypothetical protein HRbin14_02319 [bacterium HR14]|nr:hypothetical protein HRbin14_02319 [bacterium HR14]